VVEGANSWPLGLKLMKSYVHTMDIKDFKWIKNETGWKAEVVPFGEGMIDFRKYLGQLKEFQIRGPFSMHFEYPLGGAESGARQLTIKKDEVLGAMKRDLTRFKEELVKAGLSNG
jgi:L-ribulose-5-phosphate 3-epimerase UlaE